MVAERGVVERILGDKAEVRIQRSSACDSCEARAACSIENGKEILVQVRNDLHAKAGDHVEISVPTRSLIKAGMLVYLFPVVALLMGAYAGSISAPRLQMDQDLVALVGGAFAFGISFAILKKIDTRTRNKPEYHPRMTRILISAGPLVPADDSR